MPRDGSGLLVHVKRMGRRSRMLSRGWGRLRWYTSRGGLDQACQAVRHLGWSVRCPFCYWTGSSFYPHPAPHDRPNAVCPRCHAKERHRLLYLFLEQRTKLFEQALQVLEIGPDRYSLWLGQRFPRATYMTLDLESELAACHGDMVAVPTVDACFDLIICYHVLEHVPDDRRAMRGLKRALKRTGVVLAHVPIDRDVTLEVPHVADPEDRTRLFGQSDHVRAYGRDFVDRLRESGFHVRASDFAATLPEELISRYGLLRDDVVYVCSTG